MNVMNQFDKKIKELSKNVDIPSSYDEKVDKTLQSIMEKEEKPKKKKVNKWVLRIAVCMLVVVCLLCVEGFGAEANIFSFFKQTIMDFLGKGTEEDVGKMGVDSDYVYVESKQDLMIELQETVIDSHSIYLLVRITAPAGIEFTDKISFDYFCFSKGENYNNGELLSGSRSCELLEVSEEKPNMATYVVSMVSDEELEEGSMVTASFKDLEVNPNSDQPKLLVEGMWSVTFPMNRTVTEKVTIEGKPDMIFSFINTTALLESIELTPTGMTVLSDVSNFPYDELGLSDTTINIKLKMLDGSELVIQSRDEDGFIQAGSRSYDEKDGKSCQQDTIEFESMINISTVSGIYIEDLYVPVK